MRARMRRDLSAALKARDDVAVAALRSAIAAIDNAEAVDVSAAGPQTTSSEHVAGAAAGAGSTDVPRLALDAAAVKAIIRTQIEERRQAADQYEQLGRGGQAERLRREAALLVGYLSE